MGDVRYDATDGIALVTLDRPGKLNALTLDMYDGLADAFLRSRHDARVGVVVVTGAGDRAFCVGADLHESIPALAEGRFDISRWDGAHQKHSGLHKPVVAAINGLCLGGGFELMVSTDLRICSERARFGLPESGIGVVPAGGTLVRLVRQIGWAHAMELMLLGEQVDAEVASRMGLVNWVVPHDEVLPTALAVGQRLLARSGTALEVIKAAALQLSDMPTDVAFRTEALLGQQAFASADAREGLAAFAEGRAPRFPSRGPDVARVQAPRGTAE